MKINELYSSKFLKSSDLFDGPRRVVIDKVTREKIGDDVVVVVNFTEGKPLTCNLTNARSIALIAGDDETRNWGGVVVELFMTSTDFRGERVKCIRVRAPHHDVEEEEINF